MAIESVDITEGAGTPIAVDQAAEGAVQITKLAMSADGSSTPIPADADGMLVNLGANNDVTVTNTVTVAGTATVSGIIDTDVLSIAAGDNNIGNVDIVTMPAITGTVTANLAAGTNNIGDVDVLTVPAPLSTTGGGTEAINAVVRGLLAARSPRTGA